MARSRRPQVEARDRSSSSEEEEREESSEEDEQSESESESEEKKDKAPAPSIKKPLPSPSKKPEATSASTHRKFSSSDETESESALKAIEPPKTRSKLGSVTPVAKSTKRPAENDNNNRRESKRTKQRPEEDAVVEEDAAKKTGDDAKKQLFQRLWSEEDEIALVKGMAEYKAKKGADPAAEMHAFHNVIKKSLHVEVSKMQLSDKMRRLKKKFENNFKKSHDQLVYEWSKKIWGGGGGDVDAGVGIVETTKLVDGKDKKSQTEANSVAVLRRSSIGKSALDDHDLVQDGLELVSESKRAEMEDKWSKLRIPEIELHLKRLDLIREQAKLVLEALKSSLGNQDSTQV